MIKVYEATDKDVDDIAQMALESWVENELEDVKKYYMYDLGHTNHKFFLGEIDGKKEGFIHMSIREGFVEGASYNRVGYIEEIIIQPEDMSLELGKELYEHGLQWVKSKRCYEIGADVNFDNKVNHDLYLSLGFEEVSKIICFIRKI